VFFGPIAAINHKVKQLGGKVAANHPTFSYLSYLLGNMPAGCAALLSLDPAAAPASCVSNFCTSGSISFGAFQNTGSSAGTANPLTINGSITTTLNDCVWKYA